MNGPEVGETLWYRGGGGWMYPGTVVRSVHIVPANGDPKGGVSAYVLSALSGQLKAVYKSLVFYNQQRNRWEEGVNYA